MIKLINLLGLSLLLTIALCTVTNITTQQAFHQIITTHKYAMIKFYAPWCSHCKNIVPEYQKLAELLVDNDVVVGEVDATVLTNVSEKYQVRGFPTLKFFVDGVALDYQGQRTAKSMYEWIKKVTETQLPVINDEQLNDLRQTDSFVVYTGNNQTILKTLQLLTISDPQTAYYHNPQRYDSLVVFPKSKNPVTYPSSQPIKIQAIKQWALVNTLDTIIPLSTKQRLQYVFYDTKTKKDVALLIRHKDVGQSTIKRIQQVCEALKDKLKCCYVDSTMEIYGGVKNYVRSRGQTVLTLTRDTLKQAYRYTLPLAEISQQSWSAFLQQVAENKHKNLASAQNDQLQYQHVKTLLTENYTSFINQNDAVLVEYVAPGCAKCAEFAQEFDLMAKEINQDNSINVEVAYIDLRKNMEVAAQLQIMDHPTFRLHLSGAHVEYKGAHDGQKMLEFVRNNLAIKPIHVESIAEIPTPSVILYDPASVSSLVHLPAIFTRYPVYHLQQGDILKIVVRHNEQQKTFPSNQLSVNVSSVSAWLHRQTDPILVNMLMTNVEGKLREALKNQIPLLGLIDVESELSASLTKTMQEYCKKVTGLVCGYAKKGEDHFEELMAWAGIDKDITTSQVIYINTTSFDKFIFTEKIEELSGEKLELFVSDVREGRVVKHAREEPQAIKDSKKTEQQRKDSSSDEL